MKEITKTPARKLFMPRSPVSHDESKEMQINSLKKELAQAKEIIEKQEKEIIYLKKRLILKGINNKKLSPVKWQPVLSATKSEEMLRTPSTSHLAPSSIQTQKIKSPSSDLKRTTRSDFVSPSDVLKFKFSITNP